jgi:cytochrome c
MMRKNIVGSTNVNKTTALILSVILWPNVGWAGGDPLAGKELYEQKCTGCHAVDSNRVGPAHRGVVGRKAGSFAGYTYSAALTISTILWSEATLNAWLSDPEKVIPGQAMYYKVDDERIRQDIIAYLVTIR